MLMCNEMKTTNVSNFKEYLIKNEYSKHVIPMYVRKVRIFLECNEVDSLSHADHLELKSIIGEYMVEIPLTPQKGMIQAALHSYYYLISGNQFTKRLNAKNYDLDMSIELEIERFRRYLREVARLSDNTIVSHCNTVKFFLYSSFPRKDFAPEKISVKYVKNYFTHTLSHVSVASKKTIIVRIRSYIRFLEFSDGIKSEAILNLPMTSPVWKRGSIPKHLTYEELDQLFSSYDKTTASGARNYAIVRCLKDLGLRCSEVASLSLDDFDWIEGTVTIKNTKNRSDRILPIHEITGQAIEVYLLHWRPATSERILFVRYKNRQGEPMGTSQVRNTVRTAAISAGLDHFTGTHMLRHTTAKEMINSGVDLKTIADVLGHGSLDTTCIYTKLDFTQLQDVAGTWPEVRS